MNELSPEYLECEAQKFHSQEPVVSKKTRVRKKYFWHPFTWAGFFWGYWVPTMLIVKSTVGEQFEKSVERAWFKNTIGAAKIIILIGVWAIALCWTVTQLIQMLFFKQSSVVKKKVQQRRKLWVKLIT